MNIIYFKQKVSVLFMLGIDVSKALGEKLRALIYKTL